jgi:hypothetical protein
MITVLGFLGLGEADSQKSKLVISPALPVLLSHFLASIVDRCWGSRFEQADRDALILITFALLANLSVIP